MTHNEIKISDHFTMFRLLRFTFPSIVTLVFTSIYGIVDGFFVSNFTGKTAFAAVNFIIPFLMLLGGAGFLFGTGGGALIAKTLGEGNQKKANETFSLVVYAAIASGVVIALCGLAVLRPVAVLMGAEGELLNGCICYGRIVCATLPFFIVQFEFQCLFSVAGKPKLGLFVTVAAGCTNMILDGLLVGVLGWRLEGAAGATAIAQGVGSIIPIVYFSRKNSSNLKLGKTTFSGRSLLKTVTNGSSELVNSVSTSVVGMLYNILLMKHIGENGVASYGVLMYVNLVFNAIFIGYSMGASPIAGYNYGAKNHAELKNIHRKSKTVIFVCSLGMLAASEFLARPLSKIFVGYDMDLLELTVQAFRIVSFVFLFSGFSIYGSSFFTALNNGLTSALISFLRTLVFQCSCVIFLPLIFGADGVWFSIVAAELLSTITTAIFFAAKRKTYGY